MRFKFYLKTDSKKELLSETTNYDIAVLTWNQLLEYYRLIDFMNLKNESVILSMDFIDGETIMDDFFVEIIH